MKTPKSPLWFLLAVAIVIAYAGSTILSTWSASPVPIPADVTNDRPDPPPSSPPEALAKDPIPDGTSSERPRNALASDSTPKTPANWSGVRIPSGVVCLGPIDPDSALELTANLASTREKMLARAAQTPLPENESLASTLAAMRKQYESILAADIRNAAMEDLTRGRYVTVAADGSSANRLTPAGRHIPLRVYNGGTIGGKRVDIMFSIAESDPRIASTMEAIASVQTEADTEMARQFNALPYEDRRVRIDAHNQAVAEFRRLQGEGHPPELLQREARRLMRSMLPSGFEINLTLCTVAPRKDV